MSQVHTKFKQFSKAETIRYKQSMAEKKKIQFDEMYAIAQPKISALKKVIAEQTSITQQIVYEEERKCQEIIRIKTAEHSHIIKEFQQALYAQLHELQKVCDHDFQGPSCTPRIVYNYPSDKSGYIQKHTHLSQCKYCDASYQYCR
jgi:hypothetical protein